MSWTELLPDVAGTLPGGNPLRRTDPRGDPPAPVMVLGVYPALTRSRIEDVGGTRMTLPTAVEAVSFEPASASGAEIDTHYLAPLGLTASQVFITDLMPYFLANTSRGRSGRSMADNIALYEAATGAVTGIQPRPKPAALVQLASDLPGNLDRLHDYVAACRPRVVLTLGAESAAFTRGLSFNEARRQVDDLLYGDPTTIDLLGVTTDVLHLVHPHLFIKRNEKWTTRHRAWCERVGHHLMGGYTT